MDEFQGTEEDAQRVRDALDLASCRFREALEAQAASAPVPSVTVPEAMLALWVACGVMVTVAIAIAVYIVTRRIQWDKGYDSGRVGVERDLHRFRLGYATAGGDTAALHVLDEFGETALGVLPKPDLGLTLDDLTEETPERPREGWGKSFTFEDDDDK